MPTSSPERILVTAALPYANGPLHLGHLAGAYLPADLFCRYKRLRGADVLFICGSDEMGVAIVVRARAEGITPQELVDRYHPQIAEAFDNFGMSFNHYGRTSAPIHYETSQEFFRNVADNDGFVVRTEEQLYDPKAGIFLADRFVKGTCPDCGYESAYGDQCERCGTSLSPSELINPRSTLTDAVPEMRETTHWYLRLADLQPGLEKWIQSREGWKPNVLGQVGSWLAAGLRDRAMTRDVPWGVPVPADVAEKAGVDATGKVIYVWFDAPIGYISATRDWARETGQPERWRDYWQNQETRLYHFIGKDNIVFHCLIFPAMMMVHGDYVLPTNVPANEFLNLEGDKLSTSRGWAVWLHDYLERFDPDQLRYALATMLPETKDSDFSWKEFQARVNGELADVLGNFVHRTMTFTERYFDGEVPDLIDPTAVDLEMLSALAAFPERIGEAYEAFRFREAVFETIGLARLGNKYFNDTEPWHTRKSDLQASANTIHVSIQIMAALAVLAEPVVPVAAVRMRKMLNLEGVRSSGPDTNDAASIGWDDAGRPLLNPKHKLGTPEILFSKIEDDAIESELTKLAAAAAASSTVEDRLDPIASEIEFDDFAKLDLRVGTVLAAEKVPKADKLLRLQVDIGLEERQILAGVAEQMAPEDLVGRKVVVVANLKPRKLRGFESQGMLLMAENPDGSLFPVSADGADGAIVR